jgi:hypothetical protein
LDASRDETFRYHAVIMTSLLFALTLAAASAAQPTGSLYVHVVTPNIQILIDGVAVAKSNPEEGGALIKNVAAGSHHVAVRTEDGREASFTVSILPQTQSDITVSPLGFRKLNRPADSDESSVLRIESLPLNAYIEFNGATRQNYDATEITIDNVPAGPHLLVVTQSGKAVRTPIQLPKGSVVTLVMNFASSNARITDTRPRPRRLQLSEPNDALRMLGVPAHWKTAIRTALPSTVAILDAWASTDSVKVRLRVPSDRMVGALLNSLMKSTGVSRVAYGSSPQRDQSGWVVDFIFYFAS